MNIPSLSLPAHPTSSIQMGHSKNWGFVRKCWVTWVWILKVGFVMGLALFARVTVTAEDRVEAPSSSGLFCISDCGTCPVICSPPPPPLLTSYPPPSSPKVPHSPSQPYVTYLPPPPPPSPPKSQEPPPAPLLPLPLPPPLSPPPPTPSSHPSGANPPPLPPSPKSSNTPPPGSVQPTVIAGPHDYSYPYYYFYASDASSLSIHGPFFLLLLFLYRLFF